MKLLYCIPALYESGGTERIVTEKINYLVENSDHFEVIIVTTEGINKIPFYKVSPKVKIIELNLNFLEDFQKPLPIKVRDTQKKLNKYKTELRRVIEQLKIDVCISTGGKELEFLYKLKCNCKKICELHFSKYYRKQFLKANNSGLLWTLIGNFRTWQLVKQTKTLDQLVVLTKKDKTEWRRTNSNVTQIYNFTHFSVHKEADLNNKIVIAVGRLELQKGFDYLIDAWEKVAEKNKDWILEIYGTGSQEKEIAKKIADNNLDSYVFLKGRTEEVQKKILESSIFALSSRYEGFPMVLLESLSCGVPIVSFDCETGPNEIIENNDCGILVENRNVEQLAESLLTLMNNAEQRKEKGKTAKNKIKNFSKEVIMKKWMLLFKNL